MAKKSEDPQKIIKSNLKSDKLVYGTDLALKLLRSNKAAQVFLSKNVPPQVIADINVYAKLNEVEVSQLNIPNDDLGVFCKKQFSVSVITLLK